MPVRFTYSDGSQKIQVENGEMQMRTFKTGLVGCALVLTATALTACGATPKEEVSEAYDKIKKADTLEMSTNVSLDVSGEGLDPQTLNLINSIELTADIKSNKEKKLHEVTAGIKASMGAMNINLDLPLFLDEKAGKAYTKADAYTNIIRTATMFMGTQTPMETPKTLKGKVIELAVQDKGLVMDDKAKERKENQEALTKAITKEMEKIINNIPEDNYTKKDGVITYSVSGDKIIGAVFDVLEKNPDLAPKSSEDIAELRKVLKEEVAFGDVKVKTTLKDGTIQKQEVDVPITVTVDSGKKIEIVLHVMNEYTNIGGDIDFSFDLSEDNVITQKQFQGALNEAMSQGLGAGVQEKQAK